MNVVANQLYFPILCQSILHNMVNVSNILILRNPWTRTSLSQNLWKLSDRLGPEAFFGPGQFQRVRQPGPKNEQFRTDSVRRIPWDIPISKNFTLETKPKFEVNQTYPTCTFSEHAFCAAPVMRNFTNKGCDCFPGKGFQLCWFINMTH